MVLFVCIIVLVHGYEREPWVGILFYSIYLFIQYYSDGL